MDKSGRPDWGALAEVMARLAPEVDGFLLFGSNGEAPLLFPEERREGLKALRPKKPFFVGVGDESLPQTLYHLEAAREAGARAGLLLLPRFFYAQLGLDEVRGYVKTLAARHPLLLYHVPQFSRTELPLAWAKELLGIPGVLGIKDSSGEVARVLYYKLEAPSAEVYVGSGTVLLPARVAGADGAILAAANLVPRLARRVFEKGDEAAALDLFRLSRLLGRGGVTLLKQAMRHLGFPAGYPRPPLPAESPLWPEFKPLLEEVVARWEA